METTGKQWKRLVLCNYFNPANTLYLLAFLSIHKVISNSRVISNLRLYPCSVKSFNLKKSKSKKIFRKIETRILKFKPQCTKFESPLVFWFQEIDGGRLPQKTAKISNYIKTLLTKYVTLREGVEACMILTHKKFKILFKKAVIMETTGWLYFEQWKRLVLFNFNCFSLSIDTM